MMKRFIRNIARTTGSKNGVLGSSLNNVEQPDNSQNNERRSSASLNDDDIYHTTGVGGSVSSNEDSYFMSHSSGNNNDGTGSSPNRNKRNSIDIVVDNQQQQKQGLLQAYTSTIDENGRRKTTTTVHIPAPPQQQQQQQQQQHQQSLSPHRKSGSTGMKNIVSTAPYIVDAGTTSDEDQLLYQKSKQTTAQTRMLVKKFIADIWNRGEIDLIPDVCSPSLRFNGNSGFDRVGHDGLARMVATIRDALDEYHCEIHSMVVEENKAFCRLRFTGKHVGKLLGHEPTGRTVAWMGATEFTCQNNKILKVWELGDVKSLEEQLKQTTSGKSSSSAVVTPQQQSVSATALANSH